MVPPPSDGLDGSDQSDQMERSLDALLRSEALDPGQTPRPTGGFNHRTPDIWVSVMLRRQ